MPADPNGFGTYTFMSCRLGSITLNGVITISGTGDFTGNSFSGGLSFSNLSVSGSGIQTVTLNGTISFSWTTSGAVESGTESGGYTVSSGGDSISVSGYSSTYQYDAATGEETTTARYTLTSTFLGGTISVSTGQTIVWLDFEPYPRGGQLVITGANSGVRVTIQGSGAPSGVVLIEVDADGDGNYESSENRTSSQLIS